VHVDPTGNKDITTSFVLRPARADCDDGRSEGVHAVDDTTAEAVWMPSFDVQWPDFVYFGSAVNGEPREWQRMDETSDNVFETTLGGLSNGDVVDYQYSYWADDGWQYTTGGEYTHQVDDNDSGPGTNALVHGDGDRLGAGEYLESTNGDYRLYLQASDGNLVLRDANTGDAQWASGTTGDGGTRLQLQGDGNLVLYTDGDDPVWASHTAGSDANELVLEDDGALVLSGDGGPVWTVNE
jgi:hypothetical protein